MDIFNYKTLSFMHHHGGDEDRGYNVLTCSWLKQKGYSETQKVYITSNQVGRKQIWSAEFSGSTTEYSGTLAGVLESVHAYYLNDTSYLLNNQKAE